MVPYGGFDIRGVALDRDENIMAAGIWAAGALARHLPTGARDPAFGPRGRQTTAIRLRDVAIQDDGRIVVVGGSFELARYNPDGTLDETFGSTGRVTTDFPVGDNSFASALVVQPDDKIVAAGMVQFRADPSNPATPSTRFAVARYLAE